MSSVPVSQSNKPSTKERILDAAIKLFAQKGFRGTTTREIAAAASANEALIFRHFPTKQQLYSAIIEQKMQDRFRSDLLDATTAPACPRELFRRIGKSLLDTISGDPTMVRLLYFSALEQHELSDLFYESYTRRFIGLMTQRIQEGINAGKFRKVNAELAARALLGMFVHMGLVQELFDQSGTLPAQDEVVEEFAEIFLSGLSVRQ